jgi:hypothetical protein
MLADPVAALACARRFREHACFTRAMTIDFARAGDSDLELKFEFTEADEAKIAKELQETGRSTPVFHVRLLQLAQRARFKDHQHRGDPASRVYEKAGQSCLAGRPETFGH